MFKYIVIFFLIFSLTGCTVDCEKTANTTASPKNSFQQNLPKEFVIGDEWSLIVFKKKREIPIILRESNSIVWKCIPVISLLEEIGVEVLYNKNNIELTYNDKILYVDLSKKIVHTKDSDFNVLDFPVGGEIYYEFIDCEIISCTPSFAAMCHFLGLELSCIISEENKTIEIDWMEIEPIN